VPQEFAEVGRLLADLRRQLATVDASSTAADTLRGELAGAESARRAALPHDPSEGSLKFHAGFLSGHLHAYLIRTLGKLPAEFILPTAAYAATLVTPPAERHLVEAPPHNLLKTHMYASLNAAERGDLTLEVELAAFHWLADQLSIPVTPEIVVRFEDWRQRRLDLLHELETERGLDPVAAGARRIDRQLAARISAVERQLTSVDPGSSAAGRLRGVLAGLQTASPSGLLVTTGPPQEPDFETSEPYRGGVLGGHLLASLVRDGRSTDEPLREICYRYGLALATSKGRELLAGSPPSNALMAHQLALYAVNQRVGGAIEDNLEIAVFGWLVSQLDLPLTPDLLSQRGRYVARPSKQRS
jgi:hypothetical protein